MKKQPGQDVKKSTCPGKTGLLVTLKYLPVNVVLDIENVLKVH